MMLLRLSVDVVVVVVGVVVVVMVLVVLVGVLSVVADDGAGTCSVHGDGGDGIIEAWSDQLRMGFEDFDHVVDVITRIRIVLGEEKQRGGDVITRIRIVLGEEKQEGDFITRIRIILGEEKQMGADVIS